jgi:hypothetical protein
MYLDKEWKYPNSKYPKMEGVQGWFKVASNWCFFWQLKVSDKDIQTRGLALVIVIIEILGIP